MSPVALLNFGRPGFWEIVLILAVLALLFGAKRLPELARAIGRSIHEFKKGREEGAAGDRQADPASDRKSDQPPST